MVYVFRGGEGGLEYSDSYVVGPQQGMNPVLKTKDLLLLSNLQI